MRLRTRLWSLIFCLATLFTGVGVVWAAAPRTAWLSSAEPIIEKVSELPPDQEPLSRSRDCTPTQLPNGAGTIDTCAYETPLGTIAGSTLLNGPKGSYPYDPFYGGFVLPSIPNRPNTIVTTTISGSSNTIRLGTYDPAQLKYAEYYGGKKVYEYRGQPSTVIKIPGEPNALSFNGADVAYSSGGDWLVGIVKGKGIFRYDLTAHQGMLIAWDTASYTYSSGYKNTNNLAVSDDGRFIAITLSVPNGGNSRPSLRVYDAQSCQDQYAKYSEPTKHNSCEYKDFWTGDYRTGNTRGIRDMLPTAEYPRRVRFVAEDTLTFDTIYDRTNSSVYKVARYSLRVPESTGREYVGVLGMGDSYIAGEGSAGSYYAGTDTKQNKCHLSWFSYPYRAGAQAFQRGRSVACSGAKMLDVSMAAGDPETDPKKKITNEDQYRGKDKSSWGQRAPSKKELIINNFSPGYAQQSIFAREYKPRVALLSIGGNDINFAGIIRTCVDVGEVVDTCYRYYEDRVGIMKQILGQYERLVKTYKSLMQESGSRLYVVGYPQIAKVGGDCGVNVRLDAKEVAFSAQLITYFNSVIKKAAAEAGAYYVDIETALNGSRLCEATMQQTGAVNGLTKGNDILWLVGNESFHPNTYGHRLMAQRIMINSTNMTAAMPRPVPNNKPTLDLNNSLLNGMPHAPEQQRHTEAVIWADTESTPVFVKDKKYQTNLSSGQIKPGTNVTITLRSDPYVLFEGMHNEGESLLVTIPKAITPGFHTLDIYGTGIDGSLVNLREIVYVVATEDDYDGDGVPNSSDACISIWQNGIDEDADGQDDACDPQITTAAFPEDILPELPPVDTAFVEESANEESLYVNSLLVPYILPRNNSPEDSNSVPANPVKGASQTSANAAQSVTNREASAAAKSIILPNFGYVPTLQNGAVLTDFQGNSTKLSQPSIHTQRAVLGIASNPKSFDENRAISGAYTIVLAAPITVFLTALITRRVRRR